MLLLGIRYMEVMIKGQVIPNYRCETPKSLINMSIIDSDKKYVLGTWAHFTPTQKTARKI